MQLLAHFAHDLGQAGFDVHVHVFEFLLPGEGAFLDFALHLIQAPDERCGLFAGDDALLAQHVGMGFGTGDILRVERAVERNGFRVGFHGKAGAFFEAAAQGLSDMVTPEWLTPQSRLGIREASRSAGKRANAAGRGAFGNIALLRPRRAQRRRFGQDSDVGRRVGRNTKNSGNTRG